MKQIRITSNVKDERDNTPLIRAALDGETETVEELLRMGADVNARNLEGRTGTNVRHHQPASCYRENVVAVRSGCERPSGLWLYGPNARGM